MGNYFFSSLRRITSNPIMNVTVGLVFLGTGAVEVLGAMGSETAGEGGVGAHHGAIVFGLLHTLKSLPDMFEGLEYIDKSKKHE